MCALNIDALTCRQYFKIAGGLTNCFVYSLKIHNIYKFIACFACKIVLVLMSVCLVVYLIISPGFLCVNQRKTEMLGMDKYA